ncbi:hypothetical protein QMZ92_24195 [Streptomyces sp. HNM0645]|uniref:hypothetical protein n=1 Tax=Streptomyces sp. HNM0645 TaxID=2782343 RepID=UPI0024B85A6C|nr:hypothetical protein [Streptomyces sp. HNM0645]MDI9887389.1 hypothetical protein [Streptomyces sp. HNM0645]
MNRLTKTAIAAAAAGALVFGSSAMASAATTSTTTEISQSVAQPKKGTVVDLPVDRVLKAKM